MFPTEHAGPNGCHETVPGPVAVAKCGWHTPAGQKCLTQSILIRASPTLCSEPPRPSPLVLPFLQTHSRRLRSSFMAGTKNFLQDRSPGENVRGAAKACQRPSEHGTATGALLSFLSQD